MNNFILLQHDLRLIVDFKVQIFIYKDTEKYLYF